MTQQSAADKTEVVIIILVLALYLFLLLCGYITGKIM